ncbi:MAG: hypothetical protein A3A90_00115 [Candidatus Zambryskibacteria bacterium RIFCSPLOWO2_01_FULL_35_19]|uniref:Uncharacterized protein n=1 Tax=Candidatus Zambryskibacteria bacterium RIFCSPLOWO2_01_FULL_35_19 TaxID=1802757 RepID=A0A1G2TXA6_9BACT|nr:MAG: hypothetical protein A3A90_00115 [Candidatus Zambryskibacteria bacterium RIFCSPLOWO2_01_FULL_35_19]
MHKRALGRKFIDQTKKPLQEKCLASGFFVWQILFFCAKSWGNITLLIFMLFLSSFSPKEDDFELSV